NSRVRRVDTQGTITTIAGGGPSGFSGDGGPALLAQFGPLRGGGVDASDNYYIADAGNNRIRRLNVAVAVDVDPDTPDIPSSNGRWVTAYIHVSAGRDVAQIEVGSVRLQAIDPTDGSVRYPSSAELYQIARAPGSPVAREDTDGDGVRDRLMLKFDRRTVASWASGAPELVLRVEGRFANGRYFSGDTPIRNIYSPSPSPSASPDED